MKPAAVYALGAVAALVLAAPSRAASLETTPATKPPATLETQLLAATTRHLDRLLEKPERLDALKGKSAAGMTALACDLTYEATGNTAYRTAARRLADQILAGMRATKFGVLYIKEKTRESGEDISGGGPPALGWYLSAVGAICHRERDRAEDLKYVAGVLDRFPWNEKGWWAATIDIHTGEPKQPLTKPSPINKNASLAMAAGLIARYLEGIDPALAARLAAKARRCLEQQILPAQENDGFWHYGLTGNDPKEKDVYGYFMLTTSMLLQWRELGGLPPGPQCAAALEKAGGFARDNLAPITDPNRGTSPRAHATRGTPERFNVAEETKRGFQLGVVLLGTHHYEEGAKIAAYALQHFPFGDQGQEAAQAVYYSALMSALLRHAPPIPVPGAPMPKSE